MYVCVCFHTNFKIICSSSVKNAIGILIGVSLNLYIVLGRMVILTRLILPIQEHSSVAQSCPTLCDSMNRSTPGLPVHHQLPEFTQTHVHRVDDAIQPSHPLSSPSPSAPNPSQWVNSSQEVAKVLEFQLQHQSFQ